MKLDASDFKKLQWAIVFLGAMAVAGGGSVWTTLQLKKASDKEFKEAAAARKDMQSKLARASEEQQELREKIDRFQALKARGLIGPEQRLDWIEAIARIKAARRIIKLDYEFSPQRPADSALLPGGAAAGGFQIMASQMRLQLELLHEGELLGFLAELQQSAQALIKVRSCAVERLPGNAGRGTLAQLKADCTLEWITLKEGK